MTVSIKLNIVESGDKWLLLATATTKHAGSLDDECIASGTHEELLVIKEEIERRLGKKS